MANTSQDTKKFVRYYTDHIREILAMPSGTHAPDSDRVKEWIDAQASERRRAAAKALAENILYITHKDLIGYCEALVDTLYTDPEAPIPEETVLKWFVGPQEKSSYFISVICYHFAKRKGYRLPDEILSDNFGYSDCPNSTIFYLDDMSYSGSQLSKLLFNIWRKTIREEVYKTNPELRTKIINADDVKADHFDIRVGLCAATTHAIEKMRYFKVHGTNPWVSQLYSSRKQELFENPYKVYVVREIPSLKTILSPQPYTDCLFFFNSFSNATCICYFDHKLADPPSTFTHVLWLGPVPPTTLNYESMAAELRWDQEFKKYLTQKEEEPDKEIEKTQFIPFLKNCRPIEPFLLRDLEQMPYHLLLNTYEHWDNPEAEGEVPYDSPDYDAKLEKAYRFKNSVKSRCPHSWYKNARFQTPKSRPPTRRKSNFFRKKTLRRRHKA